MKQQDEMTQSVQQDDMHFKVKRPMLLCEVTFRMAVDILLRSVSLTCITMGGKRRVFVFEVVATMERRGHKARKGLGAAGGGEPNSSQCISIFLLFKLA